MVLEMSYEHLRDIMEKGTKGSIDDIYSSTIFYSMPFDIMKESDRNELLELFYWLGAQQKSALQVGKSLNL